MYVKTYPKYHGYSASLDLCTWGLSDVHLLCCHSPKGWCNTFSNRASQLTIAQVHKNVIPSLQRLWYNCRAFGCTGDRLRQPPSWNPSSRRAIEVLSCLLSSRARAGEAWLGRCLTSCKLQKPAVLYSLPRAYDELEPWTYEKRSAETRRSHKGKSDLKTKTHKRTIYIRKLNILCLKGMFAHLRSFYPLW